MLTKRLFAFTVFATLAILPAGETSAQWVPTDSPDSGGIGCFTSREGFLFASTGYSVLRSTDGFVWTLSSALIPQIPHDALVVSLAANDSIIIASTFGSGVFRSYDNGTSWEQANGEDHVLEHEVVPAVFAWGKNLFAASHSGVLRSSDNGTNWKIASSDVEPDYYQFVVADDNLFMATQLGGIFRSADSGAHWTQMDSGIDDIQQFHSLAVSGSNLFASDGRLYLSTNAGELWMEVDSNLPTKGVSAICCSGTSVFAGTGGNGLYLTTDNGSNWTSVSDGLMDSDVWSIAVFGKDVFVGAAHGIWRRPLAEMTKIAEIASDTQAVLFADTGTVNVALAGDSAQYRADRIDFVNNSGVTLVVRNATLTDPNNHFSISQLLPGVPDTVPPGATFSMIVHFYGDTSGTLYQDTIVLTVDNALLSFYVYLNGHSFSSAKSGVAQNAKAPITALHSFPNPFSQSTTISFTPESSGYADVSIVNLLGVEVARIFSGELAAGEHTFTWDAQAGSTAPREAAPQGMYECLMRMNGRVETLPVMLLR